MNFKRLVIAFCFSILQSQVHAEEAHLGNFYDFMVRDVCLNASGIIQRTLVPGDPGCTSRRNMASTDDKFYYYNYIHPSNTVCSGQPYVAWISYPEVQNGVRRVVMYQDRGCPGLATFGTLDGATIPGEEDESKAKDGISIRWYEAGKYAFLMSSWSPVDQSYWVTDYCNTYPTKSNRFFNGWIASTTTLPLTGTVSALVNTAKSGKVADAASIPTGCPSNYATPLVIFGRDSFTYKSGKTFDSIISQKYSNGVPGKTYPGDALAFERTYYTDEFGVTRWEKWSREDYSETDKNGVTWSAPQLAARLYATGKCSKPYDFKNVITSDMTSGTLIDDGTVYKEPYVYTPTSERRVWYVTDCADYSNTGLVSGGYDRPAINSSLSTVFWN
jgi:hypothetical protein